MTWNSLSFPDGGTSVAGVFQDERSILALDGGGYLLIARELAADGASRLVALEYDAESRPVGAATVVSEAGPPGAVTHSTPSAQLLGSGAVMVAWRDLADGTPKYVVLDSDYEPAGQPVSAGPPALGATTPLTIIDLAGSQTGLMWAVPGSDIQRIQKLDEFGNIQGAPTDISVLGDTSAPVAVGLPNGNIAHVLQDPSGALVLQILDQCGTLLLSSRVFGEGQDPSLVVTLAGEIVVAWATDAVVGADILARRFDLNAQPVSDPFIANSEASGNQSDPEVVETVDGGFAIFWASDSLDGDGLGVGGRRYAESGDQLQFDAVVNPSAAGDDSNPDAALLSGGAIVVSWTATDVGILTTEMRTAEARIFGGNGNDRLVDKDNTHWLNGGRGSDTLIGKNGSDKLYGENGRDFLFGGQGKDFLNGGGGNDLLDGGKGRDTLLGGNGKDTFIFQKGYGEDSIIDKFDVNFDKIELDQRLWFGELTAQQVIDQFGSIDATRVTLDFGNGDVLKVRLKNEGDALADAIILTGEPMVGGMAGGARGNSGDLGGSRDADVLVYHVSDDFEDQFVDVDKGEGDHFEAMAKGALTFAEVNSGGGPDTPGLLNGETVFDLVAFSGVGSFDYLI